MRICVIGSGVIGTIYGSLLAQTDQEVSHYVRPGAISTLEGGVEINLLDARGDADPVEERTVAEAIKAQYETDQAARKIMECHNAGEELRRIYSDVVETGRTLQVAMPVLEALEPFVTAFDGTRTLTTSRGTVRTF
jgi:hypothetical protein